MEFDRELYFARGIPKVGYVAQEIRRDSSKFEGETPNYSLENRNLMLAVDTRRRKIAENFNRLRGSNITSLKVRCEREYLIEASLSHMALRDCSDSDIPNKRVTFSQATGLPILSEELAHESDKLYLKVWKETKNSMVFVDKLEKLDPELYACLNFLSIRASGDASLMETSEFDVGGVGDIDVMGRFLLESGARGVRDIYKVLTLQNIANGFKN